ENRGYLKRLRGGAISVKSKVGNESRFEKRRAINLDKKTQIAKYAASLVNSGDCIGIDVGSTTFEFAHQIKGINNLTVITASIPVLIELVDVPNISLISTGGEVSSLDQSLTGHNAIRTINEYVLDKVFLGVAGISLMYGYTLFNMRDTLIKRALIERAEEIIVLADSSKFGVTRHAFFAEINRVDKIITDSGVEPDYISNLESKGVEVIVIDN
ncbi:MAG: DeoR/GlpR transcriptional regulator, partial [Crenarchaeota archaeon]|nr:DeoR/GlpR transcriptional regulator [Thermoproteota archaeon]